jgi:hypothetical protein
LLKIDFLAPCKACSNLRGLCPEGLLCPFRGVHALEVHIDLCVAFFDYKGVSVGYFHGLALPGQRSGSGEETDRQRKRGRAVYISRRATSKEVRVIMI